MTEKSTIYPALYQKGITELLHRVGLPTCEILIVPSVHEWAPSVGLHGTNPSTAGAAASPNGVPTIALLDTITEDIQNGILPAMMLRGFYSDLDRIEDPATFLEHLVLHEAAHLLLPAGASASECDTWAFARLSGCLRTDVLGRAT